MLQNYNSNSTRFSGCPVYPGNIINRACILEHVGQAETLKTGDILIVKSIDVAWSVYFPIISGLVTEIGGIISHGSFSINIIFNHLSKFFF